MVSSKRFIGWILRRHHTDIALPAGGFARDGARAVSAPRNALGGVILRSVPDGYGLDRRDTGRALVLGAWVLGCDTALQGIARVGGCGEALDPSVLARAWSTAGLDACTGTALAGPQLRLIPHAHDGVLLGLGGGASGFPGQLYALGLFLLATLATILVLRWRWRAAGDPQALAALWAGAIGCGVPRLLGDGSGLAPLAVFGGSVGVGDLTLIWAAIWLGARVFGEWRA